jgi:murein DD-endopeptidase MepM/ murein hydrolase activator NlpD
MSRILLLCCSLIALLACKNGFAYSGDTIRTQISLPLMNLRLTSGFGYRIHPITKLQDLHKGIDLSARCDPVLSILKGRVTDTGYNPVLGNYIKIAHGDFQSIYGHLSLIIVNKDQPVEAGQPIAVTGATGRATGEHLHFSIKFKDRYINPLQFLLSLMLPEQ